jgi:hypothetical protein
VISKRFAFFALILGGFVLGCSSNTGRPTTAKVRVKVTYKGDPVEGAVVTMTNAAANASGVGTTGSDGTCELTTYEQGDGVVPGSQVVSIRKVEVIDKSKPGFDYGASNEIPPPPEERWIVPKVYSDPKTSNLKAEIKPGEKNEVNFDLK